MTKAPELKPCPWCGGTNITKVDDGESEWLICANCEATGPYSPDAYAANLSIEQAWNTRAYLAPDRAAFQRMREALERIQNWRKECHDYDRDMGHEPREFDDEDWRMVEAHASAALKAAEGE